MAALVVASSTAAASDTAGVMPQNEHPYGSISLVNVKVKNYVRCLKSISTNLAIPPTPGWLRLVLERKTVGPAKAVLMRLKQTRQGILDCAGSRYLSIVEKTIDDADQKDFRFLQLYYLEQAPIAELPPEVLRDNAP